jgi:biopolymer transport protein ExbD
MHKFKRTTRVRPYMDFTPLIDCVFNLLIFFAVSTTLITARTGMKLAVPEKTSVEDMPKYVQVSIKQGPADTELYFKDLPIQKNVLGEMIKNQLNEDPSSQFIIAAEPGVIYDKVVEVIDIVNESGGKKLALQLNKKPDAKEEEKPK